MIHAFLSIQKSTTTPPPMVDFNGDWTNELGSCMNLNVAADGSVAGSYRTAVGSPAANEDFPLVGFASGDLISFTVNFGKYGSLTSWVGQHTQENNRFVIKTLWLLAKNITDIDEPKNLWGAVLTGYNNFVR
jgi:hypothetical protein